MAAAIEDQISEVRRSAESMDAAETERIGSPSIGDVVRQGDLYLVCIESLAGSGQPSDSHQLAPGTSQGSRHVAQGSLQVGEWDRSPIETLLSTVLPQELIGPGFRCDSEVEVTHPEHGDKVLPVGTSWGVVYQRTHADEVRRVRD